MQKVASINANMQKVASINANTTLAAGSEYKYLMKRKTDHQLNSKALCRLSNFHVTE
jgi:hypothetical protein